MGCKHKYSRIDIDDDYSSNVSLKQLAKQGNKSIAGLIHKCVAVKKRGCK